MTQWRDFRCSCGKAATCHRANQGLSHGGPVWIVHESLCLSCFQARQQKAPYPDAPPAPGGDA